MTTRTLLRLNKASAYHSNHRMQDRDASLVLRQFAPKMKLSQMNKILDIGCGPGDFTTNYILPLVPRNGEVVGVDISPAMIQYANTNFKDPLLKFVVGDITDPKFGEKYGKTFDTVLSFYCLHWIQNQWSAFKNIHDILKPGGETLLLFLADSPIYLLWEIISRKIKWAPYMQELHEVTSPYYHSKNPEYDVKNLLTDIGFDTKDCYCSTVSYTMPSKEILYESIQAVNPFLNQIPKYLHDEYNEDCKNEIFLNRKLNTISEKTGEVSFSYSLVTVFAVKPNRISSQCGL